MKNYPKITLVTPCFNREEYIRETIESILSQDYPNLEYIVIDDGSTDRSWEIIQEYKDKLFYCEQLKGYRKSPVEAINYGFSKGSGEILGWLNDKNPLVSMPKNLFALAEIFTQHSQINWLTGLATSINERGHVVRIRPFRKNKYDFLIGNWRVIQQESTFWRRSLWEKVDGLQMEDMWGFDIGLWVEFFKAGETLYHVDVPLGTYRKVTGVRGQNGQKMAEFYMYCNKALKRLNDSVVGVELFWKIFYFFLTKTRLLWRNIPTKLYMKVPLLRHFNHPVVEYELTSNTWKIYKTNPFRTYN